MTVVSFFPMFVGTTHPLASLWDKQIFPVSFCQTCKSLQMQKVATLLKRGHTNHKFCFVGFDSNHIQFLRPTDTDADVPIRGTLALCSGGRGCDGPERLIVPTQLWLYSV